MEQTLANKENDMKKLGLILAGLLIVATPGIAVETTNDSSATWSCSLDGIGATLTLCKVAPNNGRRLYVTDIVAQSTTATAGLMLLRYGTGTNCGTGTTSIFPAAATVARYVYPANTAAPTAIRLDTPLEVPVGQDLCIIGTGTNTVTIEIRGKVKP